MHVLLVLAHPLPESFTASVAQTAKATLEASGHSVDLLDLYKEDFDPRLTERERRGYFDTPYDASNVSGTVARLQAADGLVLVFPQWWFNVPAILKGFFDRVLAPGIAFANDPQGGRITPNLSRLKTFVALTSTGSPWWIVQLYMGNPVRRLLKRGIADVCAHRPRFRMMTLYDMDRTTDAKRTAHLAAVAAMLSRIG